MLTRDQQQAALQLLLRGASPAGACGQLGVSVLLFDRTYLEEAGFRERVDRVNAILSQNVAAALYREAMSGNVSAMNLWLKCSPPSAWRSETSRAEAPLTFDEFFDNLTDDELLQLARAMGVDVPPEIERALSGAGGEDLSGGVPPRPDSL